MLRHLIGFPLAVLAAPALSAPTEVERGPLPAWVTPLPAAPVAAPSGIAAEVLLFDQQVRLEPGVTHAFTRQQVRINASEGLSAGNLALQWKDGRDSLVVHDVAIIRGGKRIDLLAAGQRFTILRREANLEAAMLDGILTATFQPEGLQVGDVVEVAATITRREPVLAGTAELAVGAPVVPIGRFALSVQWPDSLKMRHVSGGGLPPLAIRSANGTSSFRLVLDKPEPLKLQAAVPLRFPLARRIELTSFADWAAIGTLMAPLYARASVIPASGPLRAEVDRIKAASADPLRRAELALALVQDQLRYVALQMGDGGLVPDDAATSWQRRYGDCKAKTALLLGLLRELGMEAVPVAVHTQAGDGMDARLPMVAQFNHVLARATIGGRTYWLDGTRTGDRSLAALSVPDFGWGLELIPAGGRLVPIRPGPAERPTRDVVLDVDASGGLLLPAKARIAVVERGDVVARWRAVMAGTSTADREKLLRDYLQIFGPGLKLGKVTGTIDDASNEYRLEGTGTATLDWRRGIQLEDAIEDTILPERTPGLWADAPVALGYPGYTRLRWNLTLPSGFAAKNKAVIAPVSVTVGGTEYRRTAKWTGDLLTVESSQRILVPEISLADARAARPALARLADDIARLKAPAGFAGDREEAAALAALDVKGVDERLTRGFQLVNSGRPDLALADYDAVLKDEPDNVSALANRGLAKVWLRRFEEATKDFDAAEKIDPEHPVIFRGRGVQAWIDDDHQAALRWLDRAIELDDDNAFAYHYRALAYLALNQYDEALADTLRLRQLDGDNPGLPFIRAAIFRQRGDRDKALAELAPLAASKDTGVQSRLADEYRRLGRFDEALAALAASAAGSTDAGLPLRRASLRSLADREGRRADIRAFLANEPTSPDGIAFLGELLEEEGKTAEAISLYTKGMARLSDASPLRLRRGIALLRSGRLAEGRKDVRAGLSPDPTATAYNNRCWALATAGVELDLALADCQAALTRKPGHPAYLDSRAMVYLKQGKLDLALADYDRALAKGQFSSALMGRSIVHARRGEAARASADRQAAERLDPEVALRFARYDLKE